MAENTRVVIVGAGHNGLVAAGYLGRAGLNVQVLERRDVVGGAAVTEEWFPGFHISTCSYICHILQQKVIDDLELRRHGFHVHPIDPSRVHPFPNGKVVTLWHDDEKTVDDIRRLSPEDADAWMDWADLWHRAVGILSSYYLRPASLAGRGDGEVSPGGRGGAAGDPAHRPVQGPDRALLRLGRSQGGGVHGRDGHGRYQRAGQRLHHGALPVQRLPGGHRELRDRPRRHGRNHPIALRTPPRRPACRSGPVPTCVASWCSGVGPSASSSTMERSSRPTS